MGLVSSIPLSYRKTQGDMQGPARGHSHASCRCAPSLALLQGIGAIEPQSWPRRQLKGSLASQCVTLYGLIPDSGPLTMKRGASWPVACPRATRDRRGNGAHRIADRAGRLWFMGYSGFDRALEPRRAARRSWPGPAPLDHDEVLPILLTNSSWMARWTSSPARARVSVGVSLRASSRPALKTSEAFFEAALRFNATSAFLLSQRLAPVMVETASGGAIVNVSSRCADLAQGAFIAYGAVKAALNMMTRNMAVEFAPKVRVNTIGVGGIDTDSLKVVLADEALAKEFLDNTPMGRAGTPEDIAACALYLASGASSWVTGKVFDVDGGTESVSIRVPTPPL